MSMGDHQNTHLFYPEFSQETEENFSKDEAEFNRLWVPSPWAAWSPLRAGVRASRLQSAEPQLMTTSAYFCLYEEDKTSW